MPRVYLFRSRFLSRLSVLFNQILHELVSLSLQHHQHFSIPLNPKYLKPGTKSLTLVTVFLEPPRFQFRFTVAVISLPSGHPYHYFKSQLKKQRLHRHNLKPIITLTTSKKMAKQRPRFGNPNPIKHLKPVRRQQLDGCHAPQVAPVGAIRGLNKGGVVVSEVFTGEQTRAIREGDVVLREAFLCGRRGRYEHNGA